MAERKGATSARDKAGRKLPTSNEFNVPVYVDRLSRYVKTVKLDSLNGIRAAFDSLAEPRWVFRGQSDSRWPLSTSLERVATWQSLLFDYAESRIIKAFKSRAHLYLADVPAADDDLEWVALMQHHGCPTRLLDFTRSPYIALYFAAERMQISGTCAVWAVNGDACNERAIHRIQLLQEWKKAKVLTQDDVYQRNIAGNLSSAALFSKAFLGNQFSIVCTVQPTRHNLRMASQQGCFLCPGDLSNMNGFERNLLEQLISGRDDPEYFFPVWNPPQIFKFTISGELRGTSRTQADEHQPGKSISGPRRLRNFTRPRTRRSLRTTSSEGRLCLSHIPGLGEHASPGGRCAKDHF